MSSKQSKAEFLKRHPDAGVRCPQCDSLESRIEDTRATPMRTIRRSRYCERCGFRFRTVELVVLTEDSLNEMESIANNLLALSKNMRMQFGYFAQASDGQWPGFGPARQRQSSEPRP